MATRHIADAESEFHIVNCTPDFCRVGNTMVAFDISQTLSPEKMAYSTSVFARGKPVLLLDSVVKGVQGNAGQGKQSGVSQGSGDSKLMTGSGTVFIEDRQTARHFDEVLMNGVF